MGHEVEDDIDAHGVGQFFGVVFEEPGADAFLLPTVAEVGVPADQDHDAPAVVEVGAVIGGLGLFPGDFVFPGAVGVGEVAGAMGGVFAGDLGFEGEAVGEMEEGVVAGEGDEGLSGQDFVDFTGEVIPHALTPDVVDHEESSLLEVAAQSFGFAAGEVEGSWVDDEGEGELEQARIFNIENEAVGIDPHGGQFLEAPGEVEVGTRVIDGPTAATTGAVAETDEGEGVGAEGGVVGPGGDAGTGVTAVGATGEPVGIGRGVETGSGIGRERLGEDDK